MMFPTSSPPGREASHRVDMVLVIAAASSAPGGAGKMRCGQPAPSQTIVICEEAEGSLYTPSCRGLHASTRPGAPVAASLNCVPCRETFLLGPVGATGGGLSQGGVATALSTAANNMMRVWVKQGVQCASVLLCVSMPRFGAESTTDCGRVWTPGPLDPRLVSSPKGEKQSRAHTPAMVAATVTVGAAPFAAQFRPRGLSRLGSSPCSSRRGVAANLRWPVQVRGYSP